LTAKLTLHFNYPSISGLKPEELVPRIFTQTPSISHVFQLTSRKQRPSGYEPDELKIYTPTVSWNPHLFDWESREKQCNCGIDQEKRTGLG
jgi:hypothetical protein